MVAHPWHIGCGFLSEGPLVSLTMQWGVKKVLHGKGAVHKECERPMMPLGVRSEAPRSQAEGRRIRRISLSPLFHKRGTAGDLALK